MWYEKGQSRKRIGVESTRSALNVPGTTPFCVNGYTTVLPAGAGRAKAVVNTGSPSGVSSAYPAPVGPLGPPNGIREVVAEVVAASAKGAVSQRDA